MTKEQKAKIIELRKMGIGYRSIATAMGLSRDIVRYHCKAQGLDGYGAEVQKKIKEKPQTKDFCKNCGERINKNHTTGRPKTYCSIKCKREWENNHPIIYQHDCYYCGKSFESRAANANFCCHKCYIRDRFYKKEDIAEVIKCLEKGVAVSNTPGWIKDLIMGKKYKKIDHI